MAEHLIIKGETKAELYATLLPQLQSLIEGESDIIANMANISACIMDTFHFWWVGFYRVIDENLVLGPFQGPLACTRIKRGKGVCGTAWDKYNPQNDMFDNRKTKRCIFKTKRIFSVSPPL